MKHLIDHLKKKKALQQKGRLHGITDNKMILHVISNQGFYHVSDSIASTGNKNSQVW